MAENIPSQQTTSQQAASPPAAEFVGAWFGGSVIKVAVSPAFGEDGVVLAATLAGLYRSADRGQSWALSMEGLGEPTLTTVIFAGTPASKSVSESVSESASESLSHGSIVAFAGTESGRLYRSRDLGVRWEEVAAWAGLGVLTQLAVAPDFASQPALFAATTQGAFRSLDGGESWESSTFGLLDDEILTMVCAPDFDQSEQVWCGTGEGGLYRSRNAAKAWRESGLGLPDAAVQALAVSPNFGTDRTLFAGMEDGGLYQSQDSGESWNIVGRATEPLPGAVNSLALLPSQSGEADEQPPVIVAGTSWGVFRSVDGGDSWESAGGGDFIALDFALGPDGLLFGGALSDGLFVSHDGGKQWEPVAAALPVHAPPLVTAPTATRLFALDHDGVLAQSIDGGASWSPPSGDAAQGPVENMAVFSLAAAPAGEGRVTLFAAGEDFLLRGETHDQNEVIDWSEIDLPLAPELGAPLVVVSPTYATEPAVLWGHYNADMFLSLDGGESWELTARPWAGDMTLSVTMGPEFATTRQMIAISGHQNDNGNFQLSVWQSHNGGAAWTELAGLETETPAMLSALPGNDLTASIYLATRNRLIRLYTPHASARGAGTPDDIPEGVTEEVDAGEMQVHQSIFGEEQRITALAASPTYADDGLVFIGTGNCIQYSRNGGVRWEPLAQISQATAIVGLLPLGPEKGLRAITLGGSVWDAAWPVQ